MNRKILLAFALFLGLAIALSLLAAAFPVLPFDVKIGQEVGKERNPVFATLNVGVAFVAGVALHFALRKGLVKL